MHDRTLQRDRQCAKNYRIVSSTEANNDGLNNFFFYELLLSVDFNLCFPSLYCYAQREVNAIVRVR